MNINTASRERLQEAFQVDGQRAEYIIEKRKELGGFSSWEQFKKVVPGFEDKMVENLEEAGIALGGQHASDAERSHREAARLGSENGSESGERPESRRGSGSAKSDGKSTRKVDINQATAEELQQAFQVDGERAEYLVNRRRELGGFSSWEQIKDEVPSFEDKMVQHLEEAGFTLRGKNDNAA